MGNGIPPPPRPSKPKLWRAAYGVESELVLLSPQLVSWPYHSWGGRACPCPGIFGQRCKLCLEGQPPRDERWSEAQLLDSREIVCASLPASAVACCDHLARSAEAARGLVLRVTRKHHEAGPVVVQVLGRRTQAWEMPHASFSVREWLRVLYRLRPREPWRDLTLTEYDTSPILNVSINGEPIREPNMPDSSEGLPVNPNRKRTEEELAGSDKTSSPGRSRPRPGDNGQDLGGAKVPESGEEEEEPLSAEEMRRMLREAGLIPPRRKPPKKP